ncbi:MAG: hypothetical protein IJD71_06915 [Clostridia bacterium]|nr:hypothetical protein [Clostridia bacterium]
MNKISLFLRVVAVFAVLFLIFSLAGCKAADDSNSSDQLPSQNGTGSSDVQNSDQSNISDSGFENSDINHGNGNSGSGSVSGNSSKNDSNNNKNSSKEFVGQDVEINIEDFDPEVTSTSSKQNDITSSEATNTSSNTQSTKPSSKPNDGWTNDYIIKK